jgi:hypothetical protein
MGYRCLKHMTMKEKQEQTTTTTTTEQKDEYDLI